MKNILFIFVLLFSFSIKAQKVTLGEIDLKGTKIGASSGFVGKVDDSYLFYSTNPVNAGAGFTRNDPPKLFLVNKQFNLKQTGDLKEQVKDAGIKNFTYHNIITFNKSIFLVLSQFEKKESVSKYSLYEINSSTLKINFTKVISIGEISDYSFTGNIGTYFLYSISEDKSKLACTITRNSEDYVPGKDQKTVTIGQTRIFSELLKNICQDTFEINPQKDKLVMSTYAQQVANDGSVYLLAKYLADKKSGRDGTAIYKNQPVYSTSVYFINNKCEENPIAIKTPTDIFIPTNAHINVNNNGSVVTGFPSVYEKARYNIFGYINQTMDIQGNILGLNIMPFEKFFMDNVKNGNGLLKNNDMIQYDATVLADEGSFYMISQISRKDIIVSYMDKNGKAIWVKNINRRFVSSAKIEALYKKETKELFLVYEDNIDGTGMYFTKIDSDGKISESTELIPDTRLFANYKTPLENEMVLSELSKNKITFAVIKF